MMLSSACFIPLAAFKHAKLVIAPQLHLTTGRRGKKLIYFENSYQLAEVWAAEELVLVFDGYRSHSFEECM